MTLNRLAFASVVIISLGLGWASGHPEAAEIFGRVYPIFIAYILGALVLFGHILYRPMALPARRIIAAIYDLAMISYAAEACGTASGFFYPLYLWTIFGNGFRFGVAYLFISMAIAIVGFTIVITLSGFWATHFGMSAALLIGLVILPVYVSRLIRKLSEAKRQAEDASKAKSQFLASVSHELRTPLNAIIGLSGLLENAHLEQDHTEMVATIGAAGRTLLCHINSILDLSRIEAGKLSSQNVEFDLYELLVHVRNIVAVQQKELKISIHITSRTQRFLVGSRQQLEEILLNLAGNAVKFTSRGYVVIAVDTTSQSDDQVQMRFEVSDTGIGISPDAQERIFESFTQADDTIIDRFGGTGLGLALCKQLVESQGGRIGVESSLGVGSTFWFEINAGRRHHQFEQQAHSGPIVVVRANNRLPAFFGRLASDVIFVENANEAVAALKHIEAPADGQAVIVFDCEPEARTAEAVLKLDLSFVPVFVRDVPVDGPPFIPNPERRYYTTTTPIDATFEELASALQIASAVGSRKVLSKRTVSLAHFGRKMSILLADDNRTNQLVFSKVLEGAGHNVTLVENGAAALEALRSNRFDVVLMDLNMPVLNGIEACKRYRSSLAEGDAVPIIALTADATPEVSNRCAEAGFQACATKPIEPARLLELIANVTTEPLMKALSPTRPIQTLDEKLNKPTQAGRDAVRRETLCQLEKLGGRHFVEELIKQFTKDGEETLRCLKLAVRERDPSEFADQLHAIRSAAGNIGAISLYDTCLSLKHITHEEIETLGEKHLQHMTAEFEDARKDLADYLILPFGVKDKDMATTVS